MSQLTGYDKFIQQALKYGFSLFGTAKTGQTTSYVANDDGDYQRGYPRTGVRFVDNGDGTITDNATGLMWVKSTVAAGLVGKSDFPTCITRCEGLIYAGHSDWRLPNVKEGFSIIDFEKFNPCLDTNFFTSQGGYEHSCTTRKAVTTESWKVNVDYGAVLTGLKTRQEYFRPVRGGI